MDALYAQVLPHLPPTLRDILLDPPSFSRPQSWIPLIRAIIPYTQYVIVILAFYIVWTTLRGIAGYFTRFVRFALRLGPIIGLVGWLMANSGQGDLGDVMNAVKEYVGLQPTQADRKPGVEALFGGKKSRAQTKTKAKTKTSDLGGFADILGSAAGAAGAVKDGEDLGEVVKRFVRDAVGKASGLDWLFGTDETKGEAKGRKATGKGRTR